VGTAVVSTLDLPRVLDAIAESASTLLGAKLCVVFELDSRGQYLLPCATRGMPLEVVPRLKLGQGAAGSAALSRQPVFSPDIREQPMPAYDERVEGGELTVREHAERIGFRAVLAVPLDSKGILLGVLAIYWEEVHPYNEQEVQLLTALAQQAAIAIENAHLYEEAEAQRTHLTQIFDSTSDGIMLVSRDGQIASANRRAGDLLALDLSKIAGQDLASVLAGLHDAPAHRERVVAVFRSLIAEPDMGGQGDLEIPSVRRIVHWVGQPTKDAAGQTVGLTLTFLDVTQEREVSQMKSDFVSFVTHQLRTPLAGIRWMLELAAQGGSLEETRSYIQDARDSAERLIRLVNDLLDVSRLESGKLAIVPRATQLGELTRGVMDELRGLIQEKGHRFSVAGEGEVPPVLVDPQLFRQAILNLVSNAVKYTPPGGEIAVRMDQQDSSVRWVIQDSGIGIPADAQHRLFEKFYRAENALTMETDGTGLGLYLVRLIVERFAGRIWCESEEGRGATFLFALPLVKGEAHGNERETDSVG
jgi:PAS domain S-box-containing protein